jgi:trimethylguanosine synthase
VYAIEKDPTTLQCARHNAQIYGVQDRITWFQGDCFGILGLNGEEGGGKSVEALRAVVSEYGVVFASPPWGGKTAPRAQYTAVNLTQ